jgi:hypothetical protein
MVARTSENSTIAKTEETKYFGDATYTVTFTTNDTFTASDFVDSENLKQAVITSLLDGADYTCTILNNVVTLTEAAITDQKCRLYVFGVRV